MKFVFIKLEKGSILNLSHMIEAYKSGGNYCVRTVDGVLSVISESDFQKIRNLAIL